MNLSRLSPRLLSCAGFLTCAGLIASALFLQYYRDLEPCPLCMLQRIAYTALMAVFLAAFVQGPGLVGTRLYAGAALLIAVTGLGLATRHVWLQWYPPPIAACTADLFFQLRRFPLMSVIEKALRATGDCAKVDWRFLSLSIAEWSWLWFATLAVLAITILRRSLRVVDYRTPLEFVAISPVSGRTS